MRKVFPVLLTFFLTSSMCVCFHRETEGAGGPGRDPAGQTEIETEFFAGKHGYLHGGLSMDFALREEQELEVAAHFVREDLPGSFFPSLYMEYSRELPESMEIGIFSFHYLPQEKQHAWALGLKGAKTLDLSESLAISPFFSPVYARVRALEEETSEPVTVDHFMFFGGFALESENAQLRVFGSRSDFNRGTQELETHVDLGEMTSFAAYENNDGFPRHSAGGELELALTERLGLSAAHAVIDFEGLRKRRSTVLESSFEITEDLEVSAGVQFLRGGEAENDLGMAGMTVRF